MMTNDRRKMHQSAALHQRIHNWTRDSNMAPPVISVAISHAISKDAVIKSSLTFVIDDTASMWDEIKQVKDEVNIIFEKVLSSKASQIENFVLVTFNDPAVHQLTVTRDRDEFKRALSSINVHGGGDCPEAAMEGISLALKISMPSSYLYIFTDASAKDYRKYEQVKSLSQKMQSQILKYIEESITGIGSKIVDTKLPPGYDKNFTYFVDSHTGDVLIALTGRIPKIGDVIGPDGSRPETTHIVAGKSEMAVVKVTGAKPGTHVVSGGSMSETHAVVTAESTINFQLGFNVFKPKSSKDIVTRPPPKGNVFMGVKLLGSGVKLETVKILGMSDEVIKELKLELLDEKAQFYVTPLFDPPSTMFRVTVNGYDINTKTPVTRRSPTPISRQDLSTDSTVKVDTAPKVIIEGDKSVTLYVDDPLELTCKVHAYPEPEITWEDRDYGIVMPAETNIVEVPYDYVSVLKISNANRNTTYQCKANNRNGHDGQGVEVIAKRKFYFEVIDSPKDTRIKYQKEGKLTCKIDAYPSATISWYKDAKPLSSSSRIEISKDNSVVTLKDMQPGMEGKYMCEARNDIDRKVFYSNVEIFGVEKPVIDKSVDEIHVTEKTNGKLTCRILKGIPKPTIVWSFRGSKGKKEYLKENGEIIQLKNAKKHQSGVYMCTAINVLGADYHETEKLNEAITKHVFTSTEFWPTVSKRKNPPHIKRDVKELKIVDGDEVKLMCDVDGVPAPMVYWTFNNTKVTSTTRTRITADYSLIIKTNLGDTGYYACHAENKLGKDERKIFLQVYVPVSIEKPKSTVVETMVGNNKLLNCTADGYPQPDIKWTFHKSLGAPGEDVTSSKHPSLLLQKLQLKQQGFYMCHAENKISGAANITYEVKVYAPPVIENVYPSKYFEAIDGDMLLKIQCKATGSPTPTITWQKSGQRLAMGTGWYDMEDDGTLLIKNIDRAAEGTYLCLAENSVGNASDYYEVIVKDLLTVIPSKTLYVPEGESISIKCEIPHGATDQLRWFKDGKVRIERDEIYLYRATRSDDGVYTCRVSNFLKTRSIATKLVVGFKPIFSSEAEETIEFVLGSDLTTRNGLMTEYLWSGWSVFPITDNYMIIPHKSHFYMRCPSGFVNPELSLNSNIMPYCERDDIVKIAGNFYKFGDLKCNKEAKPNFENTEEQCFGDNTEYVKLGFRPSSNNNYVVEVYRVCFDKVNDVPLFTMHQLSPHHTDIPSTSQWYSSSDTSTEDFEELYNCRRQLYDVSMALGRGLRSASCCFSRRHLVNPRDLLPGIPVTVSFEYKNIVPHWSTCNSKNWDDLEILVRKLVKKAGRDLIVVQDRASDSSIAIVQVNIPELTREEARKHVLCTDICDNIDWIAGPEWNDVDRGYTYCCSMKEFEKAFGYTRPITSMKRVLFDASLTPDSFLILLYNYKQTASFERKSAFYVRLSSIYGKKLAKPWSVYKMIPKRTHSGLLLLFITFCDVFAEDAVIKSSLTFVIDDTASMWDEINQVKDEVNVMFETVLSTKASQIENFVLVTFNDPVYGVLNDFILGAVQRIITKDREDYKRALATITPHSYQNYDCAEAAMEGIGLALTISMPRSNLYVFTDASAKDYAKFEQVKSLSQKMQSQVVFVLTGECSSGRNSPDYQVYHQLANATSGQVFNVIKNDVKDILKYIEESITGIESKLVDKTFSPGYDKNVTVSILMSQRMFFTDTHTGYVMITVTGTNPTIGDVIGPSGSRHKTTPIIPGKAEIAAVKVTDTKPGRYYVTIGSTSVTHVVVSAKSAINFQLGFNVFKPKSSKDIVTRPPPKGNVFMGVKLLGSGVKLETVKILGMSDEVIEELKLELLDEKAQFYTLSNACDEDLVDKNCGSLKE
ncbi:hypothetical protein HW555_000569 [Spodoptera exigua]|uniref:Hemolin n=1 Tax=Spodoptera exigua TaxID=7107 RepID=A0A835GRU1_SPOEX|nr:hypothetical protein HW555_000569 [Spodoptera exigua]